jgi:hypothetical protein
VNLDHLKRRQRRWEEGNGGAKERRGGMKGFTRGSRKALQGGREALYDRIWRGSPEGVEKKLNYF